MDLTALHGLPLQTSKYHFSLIRIHISTIDNIYGSTSTTLHGRNGIKVAATQSYIFLRKEHNRSVYGRRGANAGICIVKTKKSIIIGTYSVGIQPGNCNSVIEKLADYLLQHDL